MDIARAKRKRDRESLLDICEEITAATAYLRPSRGADIPRGPRHHSGVFTKNVRFWGGEARGVNMLFRSLIYGWKHPGGGFTVGGKARGAFTKAMRRLGAPAREHAMSDSPAEPPRIAVSAHGVPFHPARRLRPRGR